MSGHPKFRAIFSWMKQESHELVDLDGEVGLRWYPGLVPLLSSSLLLICLIVVFHSSKIAYSVDLVSALFLNSSAGQPARN